MPWYAAHIVMGVKFKSGIQNKYPVWENIYLIEGRDETEALHKAKLIGVGDQGDSEGSFRWDDVPSTWVFLGVRKIVSISNKESGAEPCDGSEITYNTLEFKNKASLDKFMSCDVTSALVLD
jgi:hypothetical protein